MFGIIKEGIMGLLDDRLGAFGPTLLRINWVHKLSLLGNLKACESLKLFRKKDPIASR